MHKLIIATCLVATIWAYHVKKHDFKVVLDDHKFINIPTNEHKIDVSRIPEIRKMIEEIVPLAGKKPVAGTEAIMNNYADKIFANLQNLMVDEGLDPFQLPDQHSGFNYTLIITYHGELDLTRGWLQDLSTLHRNGDVVVTYSSNTRYLEVTVPILFDELQFTYDYNAKIMGLGPSGGITGKITNVGVEVKIGFDTKNLVASLDEFYITNSGHIDVSFNGNPLVDWLIDLLTDVITALLKEVILLVVENIIRGGLNSVVDQINEVIGGILNPATTVAPTAADMLFNNN